MPQNKFKNIITIKFNHSDIKQKITYIAPRLRGGYTPSII